MQLTIKAVILAIYISFSNAGPVRRFGNQTSSHSDAGPSSATSAFADSNTGSILAQYSSRHTLVGTAAQATLAYTIATRQFFGPPTASIDGQSYASTSSTESKFTSRSITTLTMYTTIQPTLSASSSDLPSFSAASAVSNSNGIPYGFSSVLPETSLFSPSSTRVLQSLQSLPSLPASTYIPDSSTESFIETSSMSSYIALSTLSAGIGSASTDMPSGSPFAYPLPPSDSPRYASSTTTPSPMVTAGPSTKSSTYVLVEAPISTPVESSTQSSYQAQSPTSPIAYLPTLVAVPSFPSSTSAPPIYSIPGITIVPIDPSLIRILTVTVTDAGKTTTVAQETITVTVH